MERPRIPALGKNIRILAAITLLLGAGLLLYLFISSSPLAPEKLAARLGSHLSAQQRAFHLRAGDEGAYRNLLESNDFKALLDYFNLPGTGVFIYQNNELVFWNEHRNMPAYPILEYDTGSNLLRHRTGWSLLELHELSQPENSETRTFIAGMIPVYQAYPVNNQHLEDGFLFRPQMLRNARVVEDPPAGMAVVKGLNDQMLFGLDLNGGEETRAVSSWVFSALITFLLLWLTTASMLAIRFRHTNGDRGLLIFTLLTLAAWGISRGLMSMVEGSGLGIFDPAVYASPYFGGSLAVLTVSAICWFAWHLYLYQYLRTQHAFKLSDRLHWLPWGIVLLQYFAYLGLVALIVRSLILDSQISLDISQFLDFDQFSFILLLIIAMLFIAFALLQVKLFAILKRHFLLPATQLVVVLMMAFAMAAAAYWLSGNMLYPWAALLWACVFGVLHYYDWEERYLLHGNLARIMFSLVSISLLAAFLINRYNLEKRDAFNEKLAYSYADQRDYMAEYLFGNAEKGIREDAFLNAFFEQPFVSFMPVERRLENKYFGGYFNNFSMDYLPLNSRLEPLRSPLGGDPPNLAVLRQNSMPARDSSLRYEIDVDGKLVYHGFIPLGTDSNSAYLYVSMEPRVYASDNLYPELLMQGNAGGVERIPDDYSVGTFSNGVLIRKTGSFPYDHFYDWETGGSGEFSQWRSEGFKHLRYSGDRQLDVVVSHPVRSYLLPLSTFSYVFLLLVSLYFFRLVFSGLYDSMIGQKHVFRDIKFTFRERVNGAIVALILFSFVLIGSVTVYFLSGEFDSYHRNRLVQQQSALLSTLEKDLVVDSLGVGGDDFSTERLAEELAELVPQLAESQEVDISVYDLNGRILVSSQPEIFDKGLLSPRINPQAYDRICNQNKSECLLEERIGKLDYMSAYAPVRSAEGQSIAYLGIPYFSRSRNYRAGISSFLVALVNAYVLLLIVAGFISLFISNSITYSLRRISENLRLVNFGQKNQPIEWDGDDEIGELVAEYNKMIGQLEQSARLLAKSERETAWREMAKQIAHEIKNPLTPMKLSIQYLRRAMSENNPNAYQLAETVTNTLIEQIENLSEIATAFSSFANMPRAKNKAIHITEVLDSVVKLFDNEPNVEVHYEVYDPELEVFADKNQFISVFNNLIKNACQSIPEGRQGTIHVFVFEDSRSVKVVVMDNGKGIPDSFKEKIFVPNFTTKSSGTGLGLPITKQIIENAAGEIWFDSYEGHGTNFYVTVPLYEKSAIFSLE